MRTYEVKRSKLEHPIPLKSIYIEAPTSLAEIHYGTDKSDFVTCTVSCVTLCHATEDFCRIGNKAQLPSTRISPVSSDNKGSFQLLKAAGRLELWDRKERGQKEDENPWASRGS